jgi:hypothetical protein
MFWLRYDEMVQAFTSPSAEQPNQIWRLKISEDISQKK